MPRKKDKVNKSVKSKSDGAKTKQGVKINIHIDQSKKTRTLPKQPVQRRMLPAFSSAPQGSSFVGATNPNVRPATTQDPFQDTRGGGNAGLIFNLLGQAFQSGQRSVSTSNIPNSFQANSQTNELLGQTRQGDTRQQVYIINEPEEEKEQEVNRLTYDDPMTNALNASDKLENVVQRFPAPEPTALGELNAEERRDNALDNLVIKEKKTAQDKQVSNAILEEIDEEDAREKIAEQVQAEEERINPKRSLTKSIKDVVKEYFDIAEPPERRDSLETLKNYLAGLNREFGTNYETNYKGKDAREKLYANIRNAFFDAYNQIEE